MAGQGLNQFKGKLTAEQIAAGINAATGNAKRLARDAQLLFDLESYPSAAALAILSIEEAGKNAILRGMAVARTPAALQAEWQAYRSHTKKNPMWIFLDLVQQGARKLHDFAAIFDPNSDHPQVADQLKQVSIYTDCLGKAHWSIPEEVITKELALSLVTSANILSKGREVTAEEIELWINHMGPVWGGPVAWMDNALIKWGKAMQEKGMAVQGGLDMERFVRGATAQDSVEADPEGEDPET